MIPFEVHITFHTTSKVNCDPCNKFKPIIVYPIHGAFGTPMLPEVMTNYTIKANSYEEALLIVGADSAALGIMYDDFQLIRIKIETPPLPQFIEKALYAETHGPQETIPGRPPLSLISAPYKRTIKLLATAREYDKSKFDSFLLPHNQNGNDVEYVVYDTEPGHDKPWIDSYKT